MITANTVQVVLLLGRYYLEASATEIAEAISHSMRMSSDLKTADFALAGKWLDQHCAA